MEPEPKLVSFVLRFVYEERPEDASTRAPSSSSSRPAAPGWHGVIRHVQSNAERHFTRWEDAMGFIGTYVEIKDEG